MPDRGFAGKLFLLPVAKAVAILPKDVIEIVESLAITYRVIG